MELVYVLVVFALIGAGFVPTEPGEPMERTECVQRAAEITMSDSPLVGMCSVMPLELWEALGELGESEGENSGEDAPEPTVGEGMIEL